MLTSAGRIYHLALLQYLAADEKYRTEHVYVDEFTDVFISAEWDTLGLMPPHYSLPPSGETNLTAAYREKWDLAQDTNLAAGVIYMASLNPREPACFVMLGIVCMAAEGYDRNLNLAIAAFRRAIELGSPQRSVLEKRIARIEEHLNTSRREANIPLLVLAVSGGVIVVIGVVGLIAVRIKHARTARKNVPT
jgi:hypothetical protein